MENQNPRSLPEALQIILSWIPPEDRPEIARTNKNAWCNVCRINHGVNILTLFFKNNPWRERLEMDLSKVTSILDPELLSQILLGMVWDEIKEQYDSSKATEIGAILVVDDSAKFAGILKDVLRKKCTNKIMDFFDPQRAIDYCAINPYGVNLIIANYDMPEKNGVQMLKIMDTLLQQSVPVILTSHHLSQNVPDFDFFCNNPWEKIVPHQFLKKPFSADDIEKAIASLAL